MNKYVKILAIVCVFLIMFSLFKDLKVVPQNPLTLNEVKQEDSILGCYVSKLAKDVYVLRIDKENSGKVSGMLAFNNYEKDSSSGVFDGEYKDGILSGYYKFTSEGMNSDMQVVFKKTDTGFVRGVGEIKVEGDTALFEDLSKITYDPKQSFLKSPDCREEFVEKNNKFTFNYNPLFKVYQPREDVLGTEWRMNLKQKGILLARVSIPKVYMPKTNFSNAYLTIGVSTDPEAIKSCDSYIEPGFTKGEVKTISGYPFLASSEVSAGAGNIYETVIYRGLLDGDCYSLEYTIHSTNIGNYPAGEDIKEFDQVKVKGELESIIDSFKFLVNSD